MQDVNCLPFSPRREQIHITLGAKRGMVSVCRTRATTRCHKIEEPSCGCHERTSKASSVEPLWTAASESGLSIVEACALFMSSVYSLGYVVRGKARSTPSLLHPAVDRSCRGQHDRLVYVDTICASCMQFMQITEDGLDGVRASLYAYAMLHTPSQPLTATPCIVATQRSDLPRHCDWRLA